MDPDKNVMVSFDAEFEQNDKSLGDFSIKDLINQSENEDKKRSFEFGDSFNMEGQHKDQENNSDEFEDAIKDHSNFDLNKQTSNDSAYLNNLINNKIKEKMIELKDKRINENSISDINMDIGGDNERLSFLDYTLDKSNNLVKAAKSPEKVKKETTEDYNQSYEYEEITRRVSAIKPKGFTIKDDEKDSFYLHDDGLNNIDDEDELLKDLDKLSDEDNKYSHPDKVSINTGNFENDQNQSNTFGQANNTEGDINYNGSDIKSTYKKKRGKSSLCMIDEISLQKINRGDLDKVRELVIQQDNTDNKFANVENVEKELSFKGNDVSMNNTYMDGSVIIHTGNK